MQAEPLIPIVQNRAIDHSEMEKRLDQAASEQPNKRRTGGDEPALPCIEGRMERRVLRSQYRAIRTIIKGPFSSSSSSSLWNCVRIKERFSHVDNFCRGTRGTLQS